MNQVFFATTMYNIMAWEMNGISCLTHYITYVELNYKIIFFPKYGNPTHVDPSYVGVNELL